MVKNKSKFIEETMEVAENDLDKLRLAPLMYVSRVGELGAIHLAKECINNCIDECININSPGENIYLYLNEDTNTFVAEDDGRGLPFDIPGFIENLADGYFWHSIRSVLIRPLLCKSREWMRP